MIAIDWHLVLSSVVPVLAVPYGFWLKHVIGQQLKSKDAAIAALEAVIKSKEAEITRLQADAAPAITQAYGTMKKHAEDMTSTTHTLSTELAQTKQELDSARSQLMTFNYYADELEAKMLLDQNTGLLEASGIFQKKLGTIVFPENGIMPAFSADLFQALADACLDAFGTINAAVNQNNQEAREIIHSSK